jgi:glutathione peroxidase-family protein
MESSNPCSFLGTSFVKSDGTKVDLDYVTQGKVLLVVYSASWWGGCKPFKENLKKLYAEWNKSERVIEVVIVSGDNNNDGFSSTMKDMPFVAVPFDEVKGRLG